MPVSLVKRRASSGASGAAPDFTQRRRCWRGNFPCSAAWQYASSVGGTHRVIVTLSCTMVSSERSQSKRGINTRVQPRISVRFKPTVKPIDVIKRKKAQQHVRVAEGAKFARGERLKDVGNQVEMRQ